MFFHVISEFKVFGLIECLNFFCICLSPLQFFEEDHFLHSKMKAGQMVLSWGGGDLFEVTSIVARGSYPPGVEVYRDEQD